MIFGFNNTVAVDIGTSSVKIAELSWSGKKPTLNNFGTMPLSHGSIVNGEVYNFEPVSDVIRQVFQSLKPSKKSVTAGLSGSSVIIKRVTLPKMDKRLVSEQLKWEAEQYIPFDINEVSLDHAILDLPSTSDESMDVLLVAAKQEVVLQIVEVIEAAKLKCSILDVASFALANCFESSQGRLPGVNAILDIGAGSINFVVIQDGEVIFARELPLGGDNYTQELHRGLGLSFEEAELIKISFSAGEEVPSETQSIIDSAHEGVVEEIRNGFDFFASTHEGITPEKIYVSGGGALTPGLIEKIGHNLQIRTEQFNPLERIAVNSKNIPYDFIEQIKDFSAVPIGLALRRGGDS